MQHLFLGHTRQDGRCCFTPTASSRSSIALFYSSRRLFVIFFFHGEKKDERCPLLFFRLNISNIDNNGRDIYLLFLLLLLWSCFARIFLKKSLRLRKCWRLHNNPTRLGILLTARLFIERDVWQQGWHTTGLHIVYTRGLWLWLFVCIYLDVKMRQE